MVFLNPKNLGICLLLSCAVLAVEAVAASRAQFRFLSFVIRDRAPDIDESKAFLAREVSIEEFVSRWLASKDHQQRIRRYFTDMFGVSADHRPLSWAFVLQYEEASGIYYRGDSACAPGLTQETTAWWLQPGETIRVCPGEVSDKLSRVVDDVYLPCTAGQVWGDGCGCGPNMIGCIGYEEAATLGVEMRQEFAYRAALAYTEGSSWFDTFGGNFFYGSKLLYWKYLHANKMALGGMMPSDEELKTLEELPFGEWQRRPYPSGAKRLGLITSSGFLLQNNNFRTRVRALSEKLLCQSISAALNTSGISVYLNPDLSAEDLAHSDNEQCARCHYPMDNLGSMLFGWNTMGEWNPLEESLSQVGHAFGRDGAGAPFLLRGFLERGPGFQECMASSAWQDFSGTLWEDLKEGQRAALMTLAASGPKALIQTLLKSTLLANLGIDGDQEAAASTVPWEEVKPIIEATCAGNSCHSTKSYNTSYVGNPGNLKGNAALVAIRIGLTSGPVMPPTGSGYSLTDEEKSKILGFLGVEGGN